jgi:hypothetical protein
MCSEILQHVTNLHLKIWTPQQTKAAETPIPDCLKEHKILQYPYMQLCVPKQENNRALRDKERERNIVYFEGVDNDYGACNEIKGI